MLGADEPPSEVEAQSSSDSELDELAQLLDFGPKWDASNDRVQPPEHNVGVVGDVMGWRESKCGDSNDTDDEQGSVLATILDHGRQWAWWCRRDRRPTGRGGWL